MRRRDEYGREVEDEPYLSQIDYDTLFRPDSVTLSTKPQVQPFPVRPATAPPAQAASPPRAQTPNQRAPVAGSRFVDYGYLFGLNAEKAQQSAARMTARMEARAAEQAARMKGAQAAFDTGLKAGSGTDYEGQDFALANPTPGPVAPALDAWREPYDTKRGPVGVSRQGLTGTPQRIYNPEQIAALAAQQYAGPDSLLKIPGYDELASSTQATQDRANAMGSRGGLQAILAEDNAALGGYGITPTGTSGKSKWDAAMLGTAGGDAFRDAAKRYGGLVKGLETADVKSKAASDAARIRTASEADEWKGLSAKAKAAQDVWDADLAKQGDAAAVEALRRGKPNYDDFMALSLPEALRRGHKATDIAGGAIGMLTGGEFAPLNWATDAMESVFGQPGASHGERMKRAFTEAEKYGMDARAVYNSLTPDEVAALRANKDDRKTFEFIEKRWNELKGARGERGVR